MSQDQELLDLVKTLSSRIKKMDKQIKNLKLKTSQEVSEETLVAIAAGVAAYLGYSGEKRQSRFAPQPTWIKGTRVAQLNHTPSR